MLSTDLTHIYNGEPRALVQAVKRSFEHFPADFAFRLNDEEFGSLKSQIVTSSWGGLRRAAPYAFTERGAAMLSFLGASDPSKSLSNPSTPSSVYNRCSPLAPTLAKSLTRLRANTTSNSMVIFGILRESMTPPGGGR
jgi:hypothetical protein